MRLLTNSWAVTTEAQVVIEGARRATRVAQDAEVRVKAVNIDGRVCVIDPILLEIIELHVWFQN